MSERAKPARGFSLLDVLFGVFALTVAFVGLYGMMQLSLKAVSQNKARAGAMSLSQEQLEYARSMPFDQVGVISGNPSGNIPASETIVLNGITYTRRTVVVWVDDYKDGTATTTPLDTVPTDYKRVKVEVLWDAPGNQRSFAAVTNITPKGLETPAPGGIFKITVADAAGLPISGANIRIRNTVTLLDVNRITPSTGIWYEYGLTPATGYEITVTKSGYNSSRTYGTAEVTNPDPGHLTAIDDQVNAKTFFIDRVSDKTFHVYNAPFEEEWTDTFDNDTKLFAMSSTTITAVPGTLQLEFNAGNYKSPGYATSTWIIPAHLH